MSKRGRLGGVAGVLACGLVFLAGCMQFDASLKVNADDTVDGQLLITADKSALTSGGHTLQDAFADLRKNIPSLPPGDEAVFEDAKRYGTRIAYHAAPLGAFADGSVQLLRNDETYTFSLPLDPEQYGGTPGGDPKDEQSFLKAIGFDVRITFPGRVLDSNGKVDGQTVTWHLRSGDVKPTHLYATAQRPTSTAPVAGSSSLAGTIRWWALLVVAAAVLVGVAVALVQTRRSRSAEITEDLRL